MIPERFRASCYFNCGHELDTRESGVYQFVSGWAKNRTGGGTHGISLPEKQNRWAHGHCVKRKIEGWIGELKFEEPVSRETPSEPQPTNAAYDQRGMLTHICNVCGRDAYFGYGVALQKGDLGLWYCRAHRPSQ